MTHMTVEAATLSAVADALDQTRDYYGRELNQTARALLFAACDPAAHEPDRAAAWRRVRHMKIGRNSLFVATLRANPDLETGQTPTAAQIIHTLITESEARK